MRSTAIFLIGLSAPWIAEGSAQETPQGIPKELLCEQCPFDAPVRIRRDDFSSPAATRVITAEEMRELGVISVADMVDRLAEQRDPDTEPENSIDSPENEDAAPEDASPEVDNP